VVRVATSDAGIEALGALDGPSATIPVQGHRHRSHAHFAGTIGAGLPNGTYYVVTGGSNFFVNQHAFASVASTRSISRGSIETPVSNDSIDEGNRPFNYRVVGVAIHDVSVLLHANRRYLVTCCCHKRE
jgi:hypothetical protein